MRCASVELPGQRPAARPRDVLGYVCRYDVGRFQGVPVLVSRWPQLHIAPSLLFAVVAGQLFGADALEIGLGERGE